MEEIYELRQEISSVTPQLEHERLHHSRNNYCVEKQENNNNKKTPIETILKQNNELLKFNHQFDQSRMKKKDDEYKINEKQEKGNDGERDGNQQITR